MKNLDAAEHWFLRIMLRIPWTDIVSITGCLVLLWELALVDNKSVPYYLAFFLDVLLE